MGAPEAGRLSSVEGLAVLWDEFRAGNVVFCDKDGGSLALTVDASANAYRFVCTSCGNSSPWFESGTGGLRIRSTLSGLSATLGED